MDEDELAAADPDVGVSPIIDAMAVGYLAVERSWRIAQVNLAAAQILGSAADDLVGRNLWAQFPEAREREFGRVYESVMRSGQPAAFDAFYPDLGVWFELRVQPTADGIACYFLDVTARKSTQAQAADAAEQARFAADVAQSLAASLDVFSNVVRLAQLVVPYLGTWSIVTVADSAGVFRDTSSWHADPARRREVARYLQARVTQPPPAIAVEAMTTQLPATLPRDAHVALCAELPDGEARTMLAGLAPQTAAVLPLVARGRTLGLLSLFGDALTEARLQLAKDVALRAALSIDNSMTFERARIARSEAEAARAEAEAVRIEVEAANLRLALLARVSETLAADSDPDVAIGHLAHLIVPELGDWCMVTVLDEQHGVRDIGLAHRDPAREADVREYAARRSARMADDAPLWTVLRTGEPVIIAEFTDQQVAAAQLDPEAARVARRLAPHGVACLPLSARGRVFGVVTLITTRDRGPHSDDELAAAMEIAGRVGPVLDSARASHRARRLAESVQRSLLAVAPHGSGTTITTRYRPAQTDTEVGGDWYDHFDLADGTTVVTIGDAMGHDIAAIAAMAQLRTFMRARAWSGHHSPAEVLRDTDSASRKLGPNVFATALTAEIERDAVDGSAVMRWSNAGHLPPVIRGADGSVRLLTAEVDVALGVVDGARRRDHEARLSAGSVLLLYTDGLVERRDRDLEAGLARLCEVVTTEDDRDLEHLLDTVLANMDPDGPAHDDIALLAVRIGSPGQSATENVATPAAWTVALPDDPTSASVARDELQRALGYLPSEVCADAALLVSELVSNALRHGSPPIGLHIETWPDGVRVAVSDAASTKPALSTRSPTTRQPSGRGLLIVDAIATAWGVTDAAEGKSVWFTLQVAPR